MTASPARQTLSAPVRIEGVGLFTGRQAVVVIDPAPANTGVVLAASGASIRAHIDDLSNTPAHAAFAQMPPRSTAIGDGRTTVHTVEHLLGALAGLGITDAVVRVEGGEIPIGDGSADLFVRPIRDVGVVQHHACVEPVRVRAPIRIEHDGASITIEPSERPEYVYRLDYGSASPIPQGEAAWCGDPDGFVSDIAPARTFCLEAEAQAMHAMGLFEHLTPEDMLVFGDSGPIDNALRFADEPARHKLLDLIGDLSLVGRPICARIIADRSGHAMNHEAARRLVAEMVR